MRAVLDSFTPKRENLQVKNTSSRQHGYSASPSNQPQLPEPSYAERARTLAYVGRVGSLSTCSQKRPGWPFGSVMPYALDEGGRPIYLISSMAMHTQNIVTDPRGSLLVTQPDGDGDVLGASRVTLMGEIARVADDDTPHVRELYLASYPNASYWVDFEDFNFYRMDIIDVYYVGGFGVMGWVSAEDYLAAAPDPLADDAGGIISHMNADHEDALLLLAGTQAKIEGSSARMTAVDRLGFHVRLETADGMRGTRIAFIREVGSPEETRKVLVEMVKAAKTEVKE